MEFPFTTGRVTLLELLHVPSGKRLAFCLPSGEFLFATVGANAVFACTSASELFGRSLSQFLSVHETEKLAGFMRTHATDVATSGSADGEGTSNANTLVRLAHSDATLWVRLKFIPLTLRLLRCIDAVRMQSTTHWFADASSFVIGEDDVLSRGRMASHKAQTLEPAMTALPSPVAAPFCPLELKPSSRKHSSAELQSLASYAFEADWASEVSPWPTHRHPPAAHMELAFRPKVVI